MPLVQLAWARSGDKGDSANIGILVRKALAGDAEGVIEGLREEGFIRPGIRIDEQRIDTGAKQ